MVRGKPALTLTITMNEIRITSHGKMKAWIAFALDNLLDDNDGAKPVVLHTLPNPNPKAPSTTSSTSSSSTLLIPRLISVVEIIKREYLKTLEMKHSTRLSGLHQYNEVGSLEELGLTPDNEEDDQRALELIRALEGKK